MKIQNKKKGLCISSIYRAPNGTYKGNKLTSSSRNNMSTSRSNMSRSLHNMWRSDQNMSKSLHNISRSQKICRDLTINVDISRHKISRSHQNMSRSRHNKSGIRSSLIFCVSFYGFSTSSVKLFVEQTNL